MDQALSLYLHIPFCGVRCSYCAFNVYTHLEALIPAYIEALCRELRWLGQATEQPLHTIYFGGGTPSLLTPAQVDAILHTCRTSFQVSADAEIAFEVNPDPISVGYFRQIRDSGVNRLSIGMQSAHAAELRLFARPHGIDAVEQTVNVARQAGHANLSLDLIYGVPNQTLAMWQASVAKALSLEPDHLSLYALQVESGTPLAAWVERGTLPPPDDDLAADMYEAADSLISAAKLRQYEISSWARPGFECRHNLQYWHNAPYLGVGAGAHGYANDIRYQVVRAPQAYIERASAQNVPRPFPLTNTTDSHETITPEQAMDETMMTGLRLVQTGIERAAFMARFGVTVEVAYAEALEKMAAYDMLEITAERIRLKNRARLISNQVLLHFMRDPAAAR